MHFSLSIWLHFRSFFPNILFIVNVEILDSPFTHALCYTMEYIIVFFSSVFASILVKNTPELRILFREPLPYIFHYVNDLEKFKFTIERCARDLVERMRASFAQWQLPCAHYYVIGRAFVCRTSEEQDVHAFINRISDNNIAFLGVTHVSRTHPHNAIGLRSFFSAHIAKEKDESHSLSALKPESFEMCVLFRFESTIFLHCLQTKTINF